MNYPSTNAAIAEAAAREDAINQLLALGTTTDMLNALRNLVATGPTPTQIRTIADLLLTSNHETNALAVGQDTEVTHTPIDDVREELLRDLYTLRGWTGGRDNIYRRIDIIDRAMSALRRSEVPEPSAEDEIDPDECKACGEVGDEYRCVAEPQGEPSDAQVEAAAQAMFEPGGPGGEYTWAEMVVEDVSRADIWREDARKVLRAAGGVR